MTKHVGQPSFTAELRRLLDEQQRSRVRRLGTCLADYGEPPIDTTVVARANSSDPGTALAAVRELRPVIERIEIAAVRRARAAGWRWSEVARVLGLSRQAIHQRYAERDVG